MVATLEKGIGELGLLNGEASTSPISVSFPLPRAPQTNIHVQLHDNGPNILLFLATSTPESSNAAPLGSFVYAMPNRNNPSDPLSTPLFTPPTTLDFTTRIAKILTRKLKKPVYVGNSISFASAGMGGTVEEEMEGFKRVVEVVVGLVNTEKGAES
ncbi:hypothetical protein DPSP01_003155 [Paraphaeosphaeria sporulosa]|uniref:Proteasome assembly chaperone 3 n=1 Tax=Paraphaeosphaeria sporulosa TaxID=1460663 RepID=A0A177C3Q5_9PLEO|nr:uncharacterized protein CC84DRAFT_200477 [Paraphaeosphaeria sporulosa]OAG01512.1 hypothetical protein CC84DRAFT_200477 [Paraphaeosphaeria sporulosa]